jgi:hypothetical protein
MNSVTFNNTQYHLIGAMEQWCKDIIGPGKWIGGQLQTWQGMNPNLWTIQSMFGNTTFSFKEQQHYNWFLLRWT